MSNLICEANDPTPYYLRNLPDMKILNLQEIINDHTLHIALRNHAAVLLQGIVHEGKHQQYCSTGLFFFGCSNFIIADLVDMARDFEEEYSAWLVSNSLQEQTKLRNLTMLAFLLCRGEGIPELSPVVLAEALPRLVKLINAEGRFRKGVLKNIPEYKDYFLLNSCTLASP